MTAEEVLRRAHTERLAGRVSLPVVSGPRERAEGVWRRWADEEGLWHSASTVDPSADPAEVWLEALDRSGRLGIWIIDRAASILDVPSAQLRRDHLSATQYDVELLWQEICNRIIWPTGLEKLCRQVLLAELTGLTTAPLGALTQLPAIEAVGSLVQRIPIDNLPAVLFVTDHDARSIESVLRLARRVPGLPIGLAIPPEPAVLLRRLSSLDATMLRASLFELDVLEDTLQEAVDRLLDGAKRLLALTPPADALSLKQVSAAATIFTWSNGRPRFRSGAELLFFAYLQHWPETKGRFEPNARPGFRFGVRPAELDFLAAADALVIELDGKDVHLPMNPQEFRYRYRADREKDWLVQAHGLRILRFMSEDVGPRIANIRPRVLAALKRDAPI